jgi:hypothetical protein
MAQEGAAWLAHDLELPEPLQGWLPDPGQPLELAWEFGAPTEWFAGLTAPAGPTAAAQVRLPSASFIANGGA